MRLGLGAIVASTIVLRFTGLGFLLPYRTAGDSQVLTQEVEVMRSHGEDADRGHRLGLYPQLLPALAILVPRSETHDDRPVSLAEHLARAARSRREIRSIVALLSVIAVPATWLLARRFLDPTWALAAAAFIATSILFAWFAQLELPHAAAAGFYILAVVAALELRHSPSPAKFVLAGLATGASIGILQSGVFVLPSVAAATWLSGERGSPSSRRSRLFGTLAWVGIVAAAVRCLYPFLFEVSAADRIGLPKVAWPSLNLSGHTIHLDRFNGGGAATVLGTLWGFEPLLLVLAAGGALFGLRRVAFGSPPLSSDRRRDLIVVAMHALPYLLAILLYGGTRQRFCIPLLPYAAVLAAYCLRELSRIATVGVPIPIWRGLLASLVVAVPIGSQALCACRLAQVRASPDTMQLAAAWIRSNVRPAESCVAMSPELDLPVFRSRVALERDAPKLRHPLYPWFSYQCGIEPSMLGEGAFEIRTLPIQDAEWLAELERDPVGGWARLGCRYVVLEVFEGWGWKQHGIVRRAVQRAGERLERFEPDPPEASYQLPIEFEDEGYNRGVPWFRRLFSAKRTGPLIEIYRVGG